MSGVWRSVRLVRSGQVPITIMAGSPTVHGPSATVLARIRGVRADIVGLPPLRPIEAWK